MKKKKNEHPGKRSHSLELVTGVLDISRQGMGFVRISGFDTDVIVRRENLKNAMDGDTVEVSLIRKSSSAKRPEGIIVSVIKRKIAELIGTVDMGAKTAFVIPDNSSFHRDIFIHPANQNNIKHGDRVIVRIVKWSDAGRNPEGEIVSVLDAHSESDIAMKDILLQNGFRLEFPEEVIRESEALPDQITEEDAQNRKDLRGISTFTIDPHDAKDFDDAISFRILETGNLEVGVHIADVSHFIRPGSAMDAEAYQRATSVYLPDRVLPMLPEKISNGLCSLRPLEDKLTFSTIFEMDAKGKINSSWIGRTIIHSQRRFTYEEAQEIIEGKEDPDADMVLTLHHIAQRYRQEKFKAGAINFSSEEARFVLDEHGVPLDVVVKESKESHQLIEEFMLLANRTVAAFVGKIRYQKQPIPFPYRVHDRPDPEKLLTFSAFAAQFGYRFDLSSPASIAKSFNQMVEGTKDKPGQEILHTLGIRTMAKAVYATENIGHYGLGFKDYCHFTSPIRRYPDVMVHRILQDCLNEEIKPDEQMEQRCLHCSERERKAMDSEREAHKYKQVEWMLQHIGDEFEATISRVASFGFWAITNAHFCEGLISIHQLPHASEWVYLEDEYALQNKRSKLRFRIGQQILVRIAAANLNKRQIDMEWVDSISPS